MIERAPFPAPTETPHTAESAMVDAACQGDTKAFDAMYRELRPLVARYLRAQEPAAANGLLGDTRWTVSRRMTQFRGGAGDFRAFVFSVAHHLVEERRRQRWEHDTAGTGRRRDQGTDASTSAALDPDRALARLVAPLTAGQADVVLLSVVGALPVDQIARIVRRSPLSVRAVQHRALRRLARDPSTAVLAQ